MGNLNMQISVIPSPLPHFNNYNNNDEDDEWRWSSRILWTSTVLVLLCLPRFSFVFFPYLFLFSLPRFFFLFIFASYFLIYFSSFYSSVLFYFFLVFICLHVLSFYFLLFCPPSSNILTCIFLPLLLLSYAVVQSGSKSVELGVMECGKGLRMLEPEVIDK